MFLNICFPLPWGWCAELWILQQNLNVKQWKDEALSFDLRTFGWYNDERQEAKLKMKSKETTEKCKSLRSSPFSLLFWVMKKQSQRTWHHSKGTCPTVRQGNPFVLLESCLTVNRQSVKSKQNCSRRFSGETKKGEYAEIIYTRVINTPKFRPQDIHPCILLGYRPAVTEERRKLRQAAFR